MRWNEFTEKFDVYWSAEPSERRELIMGNAVYYGSGNLPACVPALHVGLPKLVICETVAGERVTARTPATPAVTKEAR